MAGKDVKVKDVKKAGKKDAKKDKKAAPAKESHEEETKVAVEEESHVEEKEEEKEEKKKEKKEEEEAKEEKAEDEEDEEANRPHPKIVLGGKEFDNASQISSFLSKLLQLSKLDEPLDEENAAVVIDLVVKHHPNGSEKAAAGPVGIVPRSHPKHGSRCFFLVKKDGTEEDFSFRKCLDTITSKRVLKFEGLAEGTTFLEVKEAFQRFGKCYIGLVDGETSGTAKFFENEEARKALNSTNKTPLTIKDTVVSLRYLTEPEDKAFWEAQREASERFRAKKAAEEESKKAGGNSKVHRSKHPARFQGKGKPKEGGSGSGEKRKAGDDKQGETPKKAKTEQKGNKIATPSKKK